MPVTGVCADSRDLHPSLELVYVVLLIPSPPAPGNKEARKSLLSLRQLQTFSRTTSQLAVAHKPPSGCVHAANPSPLPGIRLKPDPQLPAPTHPGGGADKPLGLVSAARQGSSVWESLCFALRTPVAVLSSAAPKLPPSATRSLRP